MERNQTETSRRRFLVKLATGAFGILAGPRYALSMGTGNYPQGMRKVDGDVRINDSSAAMGDLVESGDRITTGERAMAIFVVERGVYLLRDNTHLTFTRERSGDVQATATDILNLSKGKILGVFFRKSRKRLITPTAVAGIRGSGAYAEAQPSRTYLCTCYGTADITASADTRVRETVRTEHHESPRYIYAKGAEKLMVRAPVFNHTDDELILLESMVGRRPPFYGKDNSY